MVRHYLDHASTTPLRPEARAAMIEALDLAVGDPARMHHEALTVRAHIEDARERVASRFGARPREVVFTSGATESIAAACWGGAERGSTMVASTIEHAAVRLSAQRHGLITVGCDHLGRVDPDEISAAITATTGLVHLQWGNHEVATIQPIEEVARRCQTQGVLLHVDAAQAAGRVHVDFGELGADLVSISGHKLGGPVGVGVLLVRRGLRLRPFIVGGDQERARRAGLENAPAIAGFAAACDALDSATIEAEAAVARARTERLASSVAEIPGVHRYGDPDHRLPHLVCVGFDDVEPQAVLLGLDRAGVAAHSGSACASEALEPSPVLEAMGVDAHRSLRLSVGWSTTEADIGAFVDTFGSVLTMLRRLR